MTKEKPRELTDESSRLMARHIRDAHWDVMERAAKHGTVWFCPWNKRRLPEAEDEIRVSLITGLEIQDWFGRHPDWFVVGQWSGERYARPISLTDAGRAALADRAAYDMEPVYGGLVEPGWFAIPAPKAETVAP